MSTLLRNQSSSGSTTHPQIIPISSIEAWIQRLIYFLVLTVLVQEAKIGLTGLVFPELIITQDAEHFGLPFVSEVVIVLIVGLFVFGIMLRRVPFHFGWALRLITLISYIALIASLLVVILSLSQSSAAPGTVRMIIEGMALFVVVSSIRWTPASIGKILILFVLVALFHGAIIAVSYFSPDLLPFETHIIQTMESPRYVGLFLQPSRVSLLLSLAFIIVFSAVAFGASSWPKVLSAIAAMAVLLIGVFLSQTRAMYVALPLAMLFAVSHRRFFGPSQRQSVVAIALLVLGGIALVTLLGDVIRVGSVRLLADSDPSALNRTVIWAFVFQIIARFPLGTGPSALPALSGILELPHAHNMYLQWALMFGVLGLGLFIYLLFKGLKESTRLLRADSSLNNHPWIVVSLRSAWILYLIAFMTEPYLITNVGYWFWLLTGLLVAESNWLDSCRGMRPRYAKGNHTS